MTTIGTTFPTINLLKWIDEHPEAFTPPVMNRQFFHESNDAIIFVSKGPQHAQRLPRQRNRGTLLPAQGRHRRARAAARRSSSRTT